MTGTEHKDLEANQSERTITSCWALTQESVMEVTLTTWPQNKVAEQGSGIEATNVEEEVKNHEREHNHQEGSETSTQKKIENRQKAAEKKDNKEDDDKNTEERRPIQGRTRTAKIK